MKQLLYIIEFISLLKLFIFFQLIPINFVSFIGGKLFRMIGPLSKSHKVAESNLKKVFPNINDRDLRFTILKSWENLGKTLAELTILSKILNEKNNKIEILGMNYLDEIQKKNEQVIFFGIHQANWEIMVPLLDKLRLRVGAVYRHINNPYINKFILFLRTKTLQSKETFYTPKGKESARDILSALTKGKSIILLVDQKDNAGSIVKLFNHNVKTQVGFLKIAKKNNLKLIPVQTIRKNINNFKIIFHSPILPFQNIQDEIKIMSKIHEIIEKWIMENPDQWLWQHKRFN